VGVWALEEEGEEPDPKLHDQLTPATVPVLVKFTLAPVHWGELEVKLAVGGALTVMVCVEVTVQPPPPVPLYVRVTVLTPAVE
jgi:hypothetical protein